MILGKFLGQKSNPAEPSMHVLLCWVRVLKHLPRLFIWSCANECIIFVLNLLVFRISRKSLGYRYSVLRTYYFN